MVMGLGGVLAVAGILTFAIGDEPDYADLVPAPDSIMIEQADERDYWLSTNRHEVDVRVKSVSMGVGEYKRASPEGGHIIKLGRGAGCLDWAVSALEITNVSEGGRPANPKRVHIKITVDRGNTAGNLDAYYRGYFEGISPPAGYSHVVVLSGQEFVQPSYIDTGQRTGVFVVEASHDSRFPDTATRRATVDVAGLASAANNDMTTVEELTLLEHGAVGLIACVVGEDVEITLHGDEDEELQRYVVDILQAPTPTPGPTATPTPVPAATPTPLPTDAGYETRRVCVDDKSAQTNYFGYQTPDDEKVGVPFVASDFGLSGTLSSVEISDSDGDEYFFDMATNAPYQMTVSDAGASDQGLDADRVYQLDLLVRAGTSRATLDVGVWVDASTESTTDDGLCPP